MSTDTIQSIGKYIIATLVIVAAFVLIYTAKGDPSSAYGLIGIIVGWVVRDSSGASATSNALALTAAATATPAPVVTPDPTLTPGSSAAG